MASRKCELYQACAEHVPRNNAFISCSLFIINHMAVKCTCIQDIHVQAHQILVCAHTHTNTHTHTHKIRWADPILRDCVNHPLISLPHHVDNQPQDVYTQLSRGHLGLFTWLEWMHSGRVDHRYPQQLI